MHHSFLALLVGLLLMGCTGADTVSRASIDPPSTEKADLFSDDVTQTAAEYKALRSVPGQFEGGQWNEDVDRWMGRKHKLMLELSTQLGNGRYDKDSLVQLLGSPDQVVNSKDDPLFQVISSLPGYESPAASQEFLVYYWRGQHDFLFFASQEGTITGSDWWYAGE